MSILVQTIALKGDKYYNREVDQKDFMTIIKLFIMTICNEGF